MFANIKQIAEMNFRLFIINLSFLLFSTNCSSQSDTIMLSRNKLFIAGSTISLSLCIASIGIYLLFFFFNDDDDQDGGKLIRASQRI